MPDEAQKVKRDNVYIDDQGCIILVSQMVGKGWCSFYRKHKQPGCFVRLKSSALPFRSTRAEAKHDLEEYASKKGWKKAYMEAINA